MHDDLNFESRLLTLAQGADDPPLAAHIATCPDCQAELETLRHLVQYKATTGGTFQSPPPPITENLVSLFDRIRPDLTPRPSPSPFSRLADQIRVITAELLSDTAATPHLVGLRGSPHKTRHVAFMSQLADLDLEITSSDTIWSIAGQIGMDSVPAGLEIRFIPNKNGVPAQSDAGIVTSAVSETGYFSVSLTDGTWTASIDIDDATVVFPGVHL